MLRPFWRALRPACAAFFAIPWVLLLTVGPVLGIWWLCRACRDAVVGALTALLALLVAKKLASDTLPNKSKWKHCRDCGNAYTGAHRCIHRLPVRGD